MKPLDVQAINFKEWGYPALKERLLDCPKVTPCEDGGWSMRWELGDKVWFYDRQKESIVFGSIKGFADNDMVIVETVPNPKRGDSSTVEQVRFRHLYLDVGNVCLGRDPDILFSVGDRVWILTPEWNNSPNKAGTVIGFRLNRFSWRSSVIVQCDDEPRCRFVLDSRIKPATAV